MDRHVGKYAILLLFIALPLTQIFASPYDSWSFKRTLLIENPYGPLTDHQVLVEFDSSALISRGEMRPDCGDLRFTDASDNPLSYWIESGCGTPTTRVWVRVPRIDPGYNVLRMYHGNPSATSESDEVRTMDRAISVGGSGNDWLYDVTTDGTYIYAAGRITSPSGDWDAVLIKLDPLLDTVREVVLRGSSWEELYGIYYDGSYIYAVGYSYSCPGTALIVKADTDLNVVSVRSASSGTLDYLYKVVGDGSHLYAVGYHATSVRPTVYDGLLLRIDPDLTSFSGVGYGGSYNDGFQNLVLMGGKIYAVGIANSPTSGRDQLGNPFWMYGDGLVARFDGLTFEKGLLIGGVGHEFIYSIDALNDRLYAAGITTSTGLGEMDVIVVELDGDLGVLKSGIVGGPLNESAGMIYAYGGHLYLTGYHGVDGDLNGFIAQLDPDLGLVKAKMYGGPNYDQFTEMMGLGDYLHVVGFTSSYGSGGWDGWVAQLYKELEYRSMTTGLEYGDAPLQAEDASLPVSAPGLNHYTVAFTASDCSLSIQEGVTERRAFLRKVPMLEAEFTGAVGGEIVAPTEGVWILLLLVPVLRRLSH
ncbi:MAG: DUF2341 domain-containing protein [Candidatus Korarchaeota archaeon]|nr:DUF2341 domain-containing protein [Candidatus Korarchaeota archaeon]